MADRYLVDQIAAGGVDRAAAEAMADCVMGAMADMLKAGRYVRIPGVGRLYSHKRAVWLPGYRGRRALMKRTVKFADPAVLERGEPYDVEV